MCECGGCACVSGRLCMVSMEGVHVSGRVCMCVWRVCMRGCGGCAWRVRRMCMCECGGCACVSVECVDITLMKALVPHFAL